MKPEENSLLQIPKWPFYLGDLLLVATALAIAILGHWDLSIGEILACVLSVSLGAGLFVLPYLYEYRMRLKEETDDVAGTLRLLGHQMHRLESRLSEVESLGDNKEETMDLKAALAPIEKQLQPLIGMEEKAGEAALQLSTLSTELGAIQKRVAILEERPEAPVITAAPTDPSPQRLPRTRRSKQQENLLQRAIQEEKETELPAVSRIIEAVPPKTEKLVDSDNDESVTEAILPEKRIKTPASVVSETTQPTEPQREESSNEADKPAEVEAKRESEETTSSPVDLFGESTDAPKTKRRKRQGKNQSVLTVDALIGIGNKPYLRGSGAGLSWDTGIQMDFQSIGKWEWAASDLLAEPIEIQVFCNDSEPDSAGKYTLRPGEKLTIHPKF